MQLELDRLQDLDTAIKELKRLDCQLLKHVKDMEDFEASSKQNRAKLLSGKKFFFFVETNLHLFHTGSSKALIEEERYRKTGKRKYEHIVEKLLAAFYHVQSLVTSKSGLISPSSPMLGMSHTSVAALKGKGKSTERTELMHLHTATHGTKRWSGDLEDPDLTSGGVNMLNETNGNKHRKASKPVPLKSPILSKQKTVVTTDSEIKSTDGTVNVFANCLAAASAHGPISFDQDRDENSYINNQK